MIQEEAPGATFIKRGRCLLEKWIHLKLKIKFADVDVSQVGLNGF
jgi:hypothetical protein